MRRRDDMGSCKCRRSVAPSAAQCYKCRATRRPLPTWRLNPFHSAHAAYSAIIVGERNGPSRQALRQRLLPRAA